MFTNKAGRTTEIKLKQNFACFRQPPEKLFISVLFQHLKHVKQNTETNLKLAYLTGSVVA